MTKNCPSFSCDKEIKSFKQDLLGRTEFSKHVAKALSNWENEESLTVALYGKWGSGKSSIKNMVIEEFEEMGKRKESIPLTIEFSPWEWAAQEKIYEAFFSEISIAIGRKDKLENSKKIAKLFCNLGNCLGVGRAVVSGVNLLPPIVFSLAIGLNAFSLEPWLINTAVGVSLVIGWCAQVFKWGEDVSLKISQVFKKSQNQMSLEEVRNELKKLLKKRETPLLIILDDLDRLSPSQLDMIFQLIKANSGIPKVIFFVLYQRDLVEKKMTRDNQDGAKYLEKIIQVSFDVPSIDISKIHELFFSKLDIILSRLNLGFEEIQKMEVKRLVEGPLKPYLVDLRTIYRATSSVDFYLSIWANKQELEVNIVDLLGLEFLRLFEPGVYNFIMNQKQLFTQTKYDDDGDESELIRVGVRKAMLGNEGDVICLVTALFPAVNPVFGNIDFRGGSDIDGFKERRVFNKNFFDKYFRLVVPDDQVSCADVTRLIKSVGDCDGFITLMDGFATRDLLPSAFGHLSARVDEIQDEHIAQLFGALFVLADKYSYERVFGGFGICSDMIFLIRSLINVKQVVDWERTFIAAFEKTKGLALTNTVLVIERQSREKEKSSFILSDIDFNELVEKYKMLLRQVASSNPSKIKDNPEYASIIYNWRAYEDLSFVSAWMKKQVTDIESCFWYLELILTKVTSSSLGENKSYQCYEAQPENIDVFLPVEYVQGIISKADSSSFNDQQNELVDAFLRGALKHNPPICCNN